MAFCQVALELRDGGVGVCQLLPNGKRLLVRWTSSAGFPVYVSRIPMAFWLRARTVRTASVGDFPSRAEAMSRC